ncbi:MAG TPA: aldo/keto reductase [Chloroflexota bacterium]|nr:aldo/keto reductase [Chloroflexota bacterium]
MSPLPKISTAPFGRTGHQSTRTIFGAAAFSRVSQEEADRTMETLLEYGVNHIDTAASYGESEVRLGPWMEKHRDRFFLATKTGDRTYAAARDSIHRSLERLRVKRLDLIQLHNLVQPDEWETALGPDGALKAAQEAREQGLVRFIGVTGHGLTVAQMHKRALERFDFDSVLLPYNYPLIQNPQYSADFEALVALCRERNVAVQTIKSATKGPWSEQVQQMDRSHRPAATWYEPLMDEQDLEVAVQWVLGREGVFLNTAGDIHVLPRILEAAARFKARPTDEEMQKLVRDAQMAPLFVEETK